MCCAPLDHSYTLAPSLAALYTGANVHDILLQHAFYGPSDGGGGGFTSTHHIAPCRMLTAQLTTSHNDLCVTVDNYQDISGSYPNGNPLSTNLANPEAFSEYKDTPTYTMHVQQQSSTHSPPTHPPTTQLHCEWPVPAHDVCQR